MSLNSKPLFDQYCSRHIRPLSVYHFSAIAGWKDFFEFKYDVINDTLCVFAYQGKDSFLYLPPLGGDIDKAIVEECFKRMAKSRIARIENISANQLSILDSRTYNSHLKAHEYVYLRRDLEMLSGDKYKSKRHDSNVFQERFPQAVFRPYTAADYQGCLNLYSGWSANRRQSGGDVVYLTMLDENTKVHALFMQHANALDLVGRVVEIDGKIAAYTFGYALSPDTFCVLLEITDLDKTGLAAYIFQHFCADDVVKPFEYINTMDDFGLPNIAKAKESYHPVKKLPVYTISKKDQT